MLAFVVSGSNCKVGKVGVEVYRDLRLWILVFVADGNLAW